jgi:methionyl-tRNA formyltransferase
MDIKIFEAQIAHQQATTPGEIITISKDGLFVSAQKEVIKITKIQLPSKKPTLIRDLINGKHPFGINTFCK